MNFSQIHRLPSGLGRPLGRPFLRLHSVAFLRFRGTTLRIGNATENRWIRQLLGKFALIREKLSLRANNFWKRANHPLSPRLARNPWADAVSAAEALWPYAARH